MNAGYNNSKNTNLINAKKAKDDCFFTLLKDVEKEVSQYDLKGKVIYCNCDDYRYSNFVKYFKDNFEKIKIKKLIATNYDMGEGAFVYEYDGVNELVQKLAGNGDFRSTECIAYLQEADIVCTNPPFSLFLEYIKQLMDYGKKFLVIGNKNTVNYLCDYIKQGKLRTGKNIPSEFKLPDGTMTKKVQGLCRWFTNLETHKADNTMELIETYKNQSKFDNYNAINISKVVNIPYDYDDPIGVPITISDKVADDGLIHCTHNDEQIKFRILGITYSTDKNPEIEALRTDPKHRHVGIINGQEKYPRIIIQKVKATHRKASSTKNTLLTEKLFTPKL